MIKKGGKGYKSFSKRRGKENCLRAGGEAQEKRKREIHWLKGEKRREDPSSTKH